jgi:hypothetical protein
MRKIDRITEELGEHLLRLISMTRESILSNPDNDMTNATLVTHLVKANMNQEGYKRLTDTELLSNVFVRDHAYCLMPTRFINVSLQIYHISGYGEYSSNMQENTKGTVSLDTMSNSLSFTILLIAMYPEVQRKIYEEVKRVWPNGSPSMGVTSVCLMRHSHT